MRTGMRCPVQCTKTPYFEGRFDAAMRIVSLIDKRSGRQLVKNGQALNRIVCYENRPHNYDAWDINIYYDERFWEVDELIEAKVVESGPVLTKIRCEYRVNRSTIVQHIVFYRDIDRIDFETYVDWKEAHYMLKAHFPVDVFYNEANGPYHEYGTHKTWFGIDNVSVSVFYRFDVRKGGKR